MKQSMSNDPVYAEDHLRVQSARILKEKVANDHIIFDPSAEKQVPTFDRNEIETGYRLGKGGFGTVLIVTQIVSAAETTSQSTAEREKIANDCIPGTGGRRQIVIKQLHTTFYDERNDDQHFVRGVIDFAIEAKFLSVLCHDNIIKMVGMANVDYCDKNFFILLDRLDSTLLETLKAWKKEKKELPTFSLCAKKELYCKRLTVVRDVGSALAHLHDNNIVFRDLKPENIGFDTEGVVKLFDFGLACEMIEKKKHPGTKNYCFTKDVGTPRFMAPEVYLGKPYNEKSDVYSLGLILWTCLKLDLPDVSYGEKTPSIDAWWSSTVKDVIKNTWVKDDHNNRRSCMEIMKLLENEIRRMGGE